MTVPALSLIMKKPAGKPADRTGSRYAELLPAGLTKERQVSYMGAYEIIMICLTSVNLLLKLLKLFKSKKRK